MLYNFPSRNVSIGEIMSSEIEKRSVSLEDWFNGGIKPGADLGEADANVEGAYRRGYHQAIAELASVMKLRGNVTSESLSKWVEEDGMRWRKNVPLVRKIIPPSLEPK